MATLRCQSCGVDFVGRPNKKYCGPACKRKAEMQARERKRQARYDAREPWGEPTDWSDLKPSDWSDLPTWEEAFGDLPTWDEIVATNGP